MHIARYFVTFRDGDWKIRYADAFYGPYDRQKTAISQAIDMALIVGQSGGKAEVLVENEDGEARLEWPLSHDLSAIEERRFWESYGTPAVTPAGAAVAGKAIEPEERSVPDIASTPESEPMTDRPVAPDGPEDPAQPDDIERLEDEDLHDADLVESRTPPQESSIEELAAIMSAALDGAEPTTVSPEALPADIAPAANDEGPIVDDAEVVER